MHTPEIILQALLVGWNQWPERVGDDWERLLPDIQRLIDAIATSDDEDERALLADELLDLFRPYPRAWRHLSAAIRDIERQRSATYRGGDEESLAPTAPDLLSLAADIRLRIMPFETAARDDVSFSLESESVAPTVIRYTDISAPRRVWVETPRFSVIVRLTMDAPEFSAAVLDMAVHADEEEPVLVQISAPGFDVLSAPLQSTPILPDADSPPVLVRLADPDSTRSPAASIASDCVSVALPDSAMSPSAASAPEPFSSPLPQNTRSPEASIGL
jgi:hypothetical protein